MPSCNKCGAAIEFFPILKLGGEETRGHPFDPIVVEGEAATHAISSNTTGLNGAIGPAVSVRRAHQLTKDKPVLFIRDHFVSCPKAEYR